MDSLVLARTATKEPILIVEGRSDVEFFERFLRLAVVVIPAGEKDVVIEALRVVKAEGHRLIAGVVDADFWHIEGSWPGCDGLFVTDEHDLEMMMIRSGAFEEFVKTLGSKSKLLAFGKDVRSAVLRGASIIGHLRYLSVLHGLSLRFEGLAIDRLLDDDLCVDERELVRRVLALGGGKVGFDELVALMDARGSYDVYQICCGHDAMEILGKALRKVLGNRTKRETERENLEGILRLAYDGKYLAATALYRDLLNWAHECGADLFDSRRVDEPRVWA